jgi:hypothetical protein
VQWNPNGPAVLKVVVLLVPGFMFPVSHNPGVSLVEVCAMPSLFFHVTTVPIATVMLLGLKLIGCMTNVFAGGVPGGVPPDPSDGESPLHPASPETILARAMNMYNTAVRFISPPRPILPYRIDL